MHLRLILPVLLVLTFLISACGDEENPTATQPPEPATFTLSGSGKKAKMTGPATVEAGLVEVRFQNRSGDDAGATLIRIEGAHTAAEAVKAGQAWGDEGKPLPEWIHFVGGSSEIAKGKSDTSLQVLETGTYAALDINTNAYTEFEVQGDIPGQLPALPARIEARDYSFTTKGLTAGTRQVLFTNKGKEPHFALALPIREGFTIADVRKAVREEEGEGGGPDPVIEDQAVSTGILDGGESQVVNLTLKKGNWALLCFVPDRKGGPPHAFMGMVSEAVVQ